MGFIKKSGDQLKIWKKKFKAKFKYRKVASSRLSRLVAHFQTVYEGEFWCLCTVTFGKYGPKLNSRPVYCSRLYGSETRNFTWFYPRVFNWPKSSGLLWLNDLYYFFFHISRSLYWQKILKIGFPKKCSLRCLWLWLAFAMHFNLSNRCPPTLCQVLSPSSMHQSCQSGEAQLFG